MEFIALTMAAMSFIFGLIAITRVDQVKKEDPHVRIPSEEG